MKQSESHRQGTRGRLAAEGRQREVTHAVSELLQMLNAKLDWTQQLGDAFLAQQADVLTTVQPLRNGRRLLAT